MPTVENVATPLAAVAVAVPTTVAPLLTLIVTTVVLSPVAAFPLASETEIAGWVVKAAPLAAPAAEVVMDREPSEAAAAIDCVASLSPLALNVSVYVTPAVPEIPTPENVATPADAVAVAVPTTVPPLLTAIVTTVELSAERVLPNASRTATTG